MPRKTLTNHTQMQIERPLLKRLADYKVHPNQSYSEVIRKLLDFKEQTKGESAPVKHPVKTSRSDKSEVKK